MKAHLREDDTPTAVCGQDVGPFGAIGFPADRLPEVTCLKCLKQVAANPQKFAREAEGLDLAGDPRDRAIFRQRLARRLPRYAEWLANQPDVDDHGDGTASATDDHDIDLTPEGLRGAGGGRGPG